MRRPPARAVAGQLLRRATQLGATAFVVYAALSLHWRNFKVSHNSARLVALMTDDLWGRAYAANEAVLGLVGDPLSVSEGLLGMPWTVRLGPWTFTDPMAVLGVAAQGVLPPAAMAAGALLAVGLALLAGRIFCSHLCPARLAFEVANAVRMGLLALGVPLPAIALPRLGGWMLLASLGLSAGLGIGVLAWILPYLALGHGVAAWMMTGAAGATLTAFLVMVGFDLLVAPGQVCRSLCPTGFLLEQLGRWAPLRLAAEGAPCPSGCDLCRRVCPYGLHPGQGTQHPTCDACGRCTLVCPSQKLARRLRTGRKA